MTRKPPKGKSLAELNPKLAKQWHTSKNGDLTTLDIFLKSNKPFWWKCQKGIDHEWESSPNNRNKGSGCPVCSGYKAVKSNCLATTHPDLAKEWHLTKNGDLTPNDVTSGSGKDIWWKCDKGDDHEWVSTVNNRKNGNGCSICSSKQVVKSNCLATTHPDLAKEWHLTKNGDLTPNDVTYGSDKKIWWKCEEGDDHEWVSTVDKRSSGRKCPVCSGDKVVKSTCLATTHPDIAKEWHLTKNGDLTANDVSYGSNEDIWWKCDKGNDHEWMTKVAKRSAGENCTICSGRKLAKSTSLATTHPEIANQWHHTLNHPITPNQTTKGRTDYYWWKCDKVEDHIWEASPNNRTRGRDCPSCAEYGFNRSDDALFYIRKINLDNGKQALKFGITNNMDGDREKQQKRHVEGSVDTILREEVAGETALDIENLCKKHFGRKGYLTVQEFPDGFSETIKYSEENLNKIKLIVEEVLNEKVEKKL